MGNGGTAPLAATQSTGGVGGTYTITGGVGGAAAVAGTGNNTGGTGSAFTWTGGIGGAATGNTTGNNTGGDGGAVTLSAGTPTDRRENDGSIALAVTRVLPYSRAAPHPISVRSPPDTSC